jgi:hypothetical protein
MALPDERGAPNSEALSGDTVVNWLSGAVTRTLRTRNQFTFRSVDMESLDFAISDNGVDIFCCCGYRAAECDVVHVTNSKLTFQ